MKVVCAWCGLVLVEGDEPISHEMCEACAAEVERQLREFEELEEVEHDTTG